MDERSRRFFDETPEPEGTFDEVLDQAYEEAAREMDQRHQPEEGNVTQTPDITQIIQDQIQQALEGMGQQRPATAPAQQQISFEDILAQVDPRDSDAALAMLDFLLKTGRLNRVGVLDGGQGYLFVYQEPRGTSKQGYVPGGTKGDRMVDAAVDQARAQGARPAKSGLCKHCFSAISKAEHDMPRLQDVEDDQEAFFCSGAPDNVHEFA